MKNWMQDYLKKQQAALDALPLDRLPAVLEAFRQAWREDRQIFVFGNGGSACNASHFATDLGKGSSDKLARRFRVLSLNDNTSWLTALGNDYAYEDVFVRQLMNYARPGDIAFTMSVSGSSPNLVKAFEWARENGLVTIAFVGQKRGKLAEIADHVLVVEDGHYGRAEDMHMTLAHFICYAFMEQPEWVAAS
jgi:D-sedoheptulose 7-phosphate isomerase